MGDPVQAPPSFSNFRFNSIGHISLLSRLSGVSRQAQPSQTDEGEGDEDDLYIDMDVDTPEPSSKQPVLLARIGGRLSTLEDADSGEADNHSPSVPVSPQLSLGKRPVPDETIADQPVPLEQSEATNALNLTSCDAAEGHATAASLQGAPLLSISAILANAPKQQPTVDHPGQLQVSTDGLPTPPPTSSFVPQDVGIPVHILHQPSTSPSCTYPLLEQLLQEERTVWSEAAEMKRSRAGLGICNTPTAPDEPAPKAQSQSVHTNISTPTFMKDNRNHMHSESMPINTDSTYSPNDHIPRGDQHDHPSLLSKPAEGDGRFKHRVHSSSSPSQARGFGDDSLRPISATVSTALPNAERMLQMCGNAGQDTINEFAPSKPRPSVQTPVESVADPKNRSPREEQLKYLLKARKSGRSLDPADMPEGRASQSQKGSEVHSPSPQSPSIGIPLRSEDGQCLDLDTTSAKSVLPQTDQPQGVCRNDNDRSASHAEPILNDSSGRSISHVAHSSTIKRKASQTPPPSSGMCTNQITNPVTKRQKTTYSGILNNTLNTTLAGSNATSDLNSPSCKLSGVTPPPSFPVSVPRNSTSATTQQSQSSNITNRASDTSISRKQAAARAKRTPSPSVGGNETKTPGSSIPPIKTEDNTNESSGLDLKPSVKIKKEEPEEIMIRVKIEEDMKTFQADLQKPLQMRANTIPLKKQEGGDGTLNPSSLVQGRSHSVPGSNYQPESANPQQHQLGEQDVQTNRLREKVLVSKTTPRNHSCVYQKASSHSQNNATVQQNGSPELVLAKEQVHLPRPIPTEASGTRTPLPEQRRFDQSCTLNPRLISPAPSSGALTSTSGSHSREELSSQPRNSDHRIRPSGTTNETTGRLAARSIRQRERSRESNPRLLDHWSPPRARVPLRARPIADTYRPPPSPPEHAQSVPRRTLNVHRRDSDEDNVAQRCARRGDTWIPSDGYTSHPSHRSRSASPRRGYRSRMYRSPSPSPRQAKINSPASNQERAAMRTPSSHLHSPRVERPGLSRSFDSQSTNYLPRPSWTLLNGMPPALGRHDEQPAPLHHASADLANTRCEELQPALDTGARNTRTERDLIPNDTYLCPVDHGHPSSDEHTQSHDDRLVPVLDLGPTDETTKLMHDQHVSCAQGAAVIHNERPITASPEPSLDLGRANIAAASESNVSILQGESCSSLYSASANPTSRFLWPSHEQYCGTLRGPTTSEASIEPITNYREEERVLGAKILSCRESVYNDVQTALDQKDVQQFRAEGRTKEKWSLKSVQRTHGAEGPTHPNTDSMRKHPELCDPPPVVSEPSPNSPPFPPSPRRPNTSRTPQRGRPHRQPETSSPTLAQRIRNEPTKPAPVHYDSDSATSLDPSPPHSPIPTLSSRLGDLLIHDESTHLKNHIPSTTNVSSDMALSSRIAEPKPRAHQARHALPPKPVPYREPINSDSSASSKSKLSSNPQKPSHASSAPQLLKRFNVSESEREPARSSKKSRRGGRGAASAGRGRGRVRVGDHYPPRSPPHKPSARSKPPLEDRLS